MRVEKFAARASVGSYFLLSGPWFALSAFYLYLLAVKGPFHGGTGVVLLCAAVGFFSSVWLSGFLLEVDGERFTYRDGFYRAKKIDITEITGVKNAWVEWGRPGRNLKVPRLLISTGKLGKITVNVTPFEKSKYQGIVSLLKRAAVHR